MVTLTRPVGHESCPPNSHPLGTSECDLLCRCDEVRMGFGWAWSLMPGELIRDRKRHTETGEGPVRMEKKWERFGHRPGTPGATGSWKRQEGSVPGGC